MTRTTRPRIPGYRIEGIQGDGAMAIVYRAVHKGLKKPVALKILHESVAKDDEYRQRFLREGKAAARLNHPNVVRAYEAGEHKGTYYFAMELVQGEDLSDRLAREGTLPEEEALRIGVELAHALEAAEDNGMVHRDLKPENVLLGKRGEVKLADLGLARILGDGSLTTEGFTLGTVAFFSPEQCRGSRDLDIRSDLYALGALIYNLITGDLPHGRGDNPILTMERILKEEPQDIEAVADVSPATAQAVQKLMAKDSGERPACAAEGVALLERALDRVGLPDSEPELTPVRRKRRRVKRRRPASSGFPVAVALLVAVALGLAVGLALWMARSGEAIGAGESRTGEAGGDQ